MRITIFGGHGKVALLLAPLLVEEGHAVTSVVRNPDHAEDVAASGATPVVSSVEEASTEDLATLLSGQDAVAAAVIADPRSYGRTLVFGAGDVPVDEWLDRG